MEQLTDSTQSPPHKKARARAPEGKLSRRIIDPVGFQLGCWGIPLQYVLQQHVPIHAGLDRRTKDPNEEGRKGQVSHDWQSALDITLSPFFRDCAEVGAAIVSILGGLVVSRPVASIHQAFGSWSSFMAWSLRRLAASMVCAGDIRVIGAPSDPAVGAITSLAWGTVGGTRKWSSFITPLRRSSCSAITVKTGAPS